MKKNEIFKTSDMALVAYLTVRKYIIKDVMCDGMGKGTFLIQDDKERPSHVLEFFNRQTVVEPLAFLEQVKNLKSLLRQ